MKLHDSKKHPYMRATFWKDNKFWEQEHACNYSKEAVARFEASRLEALRIYNDKFKTDANSEK